MLRKIKLSFISCIIYKLCSLKIRVKAEKHLSTMALDTCNYKAIFKMLENIGNIFLVRFKKFSKFIKMVEMIVHKFIEN